MYKIDVHPDEQVCSDIESPSASTSEISKLTRCASSIALFDQTSWQKQKIQEHFSDFSSCTNEPKIIKSAKQPILWKSKFLEINDTAFVSSIDLPDEINSLNTSYKFFI